MSGLRDKIAAANALNVELRNRVRSLEETNEKKDQLVKDWNDIIETFELELHKSIDEN